MSSLQPNFFIFYHKLNKDWPIELVSKGFHFWLQVGQDKWLVQFVTEILLFQSLTGRKVTCPNCDWSFSFSIAIWTRLICPDKYNPLIFSIWQMILTCVNYDVIKYVVINYKLNGSSKNGCRRFYYINVNLCVKIDIKIEASKLMPMWQTTQNWNIASILTTLLNMSIYLDLGERGHVHIIINF
jgi:hypothetical protein